MIGQTLGRFRIRESLGTGGMGGVWVGEDETSGREVAIKTLLPHIASDENFLHRFVREAEAYRRLDHPNIVAYVASGVHEGIYYLVVEYVRGKTLDDLLRAVGGPLGPKRAVLIVQDLLKAVGYAHSHRIIHRDIKPSNIIVSRQGHVKLLDFGVASADDRLVQTNVGTILGSFQYSAPEQNQGQEVDERSDLYSVGLIFWELLTGRRALVGRNILEVISTQIGPGIPAPSSVEPGVPAPLDVVLAKLLHRARGNRYDDAAAALEDLEAVAGMF